METPLANSFALLLTLAMGVLLLLLPRKHALVPVVIVAGYITLDQKIYIGLMGFSMIRLLLIIGFIRILVKNEYDNIQIVTLDKLFIGWVVSFVFIYTILYGDYKAFNLKMGHAYDGLGVYFLARCLIKDSAGVINLYKNLSLLILPLALLMIIEGITNRNMFSIFGAPLIGEIRDGHVRCQGSFSHPILAGTFGATLMPVFIALLFQKETGAIYAILGGIGATVITISSRSSGPLFAYMVGIIAMLMWRFRSRMRMVRWGLAAFFLTAHIFMEAPVWFLMARLSALTGGSGWHRSELIEQTLRNFNEWWFYGTKYTAHWMDAPNPSNPDMVDITNWFVGQAVNGGIITLAIFVFIIIECYKYVGINVSYLNGKNNNIEIFMWSLGGSVTAHITSFLSVAYFDQIVVFWYILIASICSTNINIKSRQVNEVDTDISEESSCSMGLIGHG